MDSTGAWLAVGALTLGGAAFIYGGFYKLRRFRLIADTPTSKIRSMAIGLVEIKGQVIPEQTVETPFSATECVYYKYVIKEYRRHTSRDSKGRTKTTYRWDTVSSGDRRLPFHVRDDTGQVWLDPSGADFKVSQRRVFYQDADFVGSFGSILGALKNLISGESVKPDVSGWNLRELTSDSPFTFNTSVGDRKYYEYYLKAEDMLYALGTAAIDREAPDGVLIQKGENEKTYIISDSSEKQLIRKMKTATIGLFVLGVAAITGGIILFLRFTGNI